jgi:glyoxylate utilization-related uncharacterized protein
MQGPEHKGEDQAHGALQFSVGCSYFLPGGGADFSPGRPFDTVYMCLEGEITIIDKDDNEISLKPFETIYIAPYEGRSIKNNTSSPAKMLVILGSAVSEDCQ